MARAQFRLSAFTAALAIAACILAHRSIAAEAESAGVVSNIKVVSDKVEDVSSLAAWKKSVIKEGMSDGQKAMAVWNSVHRYQHQDAPPNEFLQCEDNVQDAIKLFNVYGYSLCSVATAHSESLARYAGLKARGWTISHHVVSEIWWDDAWRLMDASLICYFPKADGKPAGVEEIVAGVTEWLGKSPGLKGNDAKLRDYQFKGPGWKSGPDILSRCVGYDERGWLPAATHGWYATMQEYDGSTKFLYEPGYSAGYKVNIQLRKGERLTRNWSNKGLHVNMLDGAAPGCLKMQVGKDALRYTPKAGDLANGRVGNGTLEYDVPLADGSFKAGALAVENLACKADDNTPSTLPALHIKEGTSEGTFILRMPSSYVYLSGEVALKSVVGAGGDISVSFSDNHGLDWKEVGRIAASGEQKLDLKSLVFRRYDYRLKFVLKGKGTGLDALKITHDIQHSQRPLPALAQGSNSIAFRAGAQEGTITIEGSANPKNKGKQLLFTDFHPALKGVDAAELNIPGARGEISVPISTPGEIKRLRASAFYRARDARDGWDVEVSFDGGKEFKPWARLPGETGRGVVRDLELSGIPPGTRSATIRMTGTNRNATLISNLRIDADYAEPRGGFRPVKVTYRWEEAGQPKEDVHIARLAEETYTIDCAAKPVMKSIVLELAE